MSKATILVVDDETTIRLFLQETLTSDGHQVIAAASGEEALDYIAHHSFDLALLDLNLTGINGMEVLAELRQHSPDTVIIMLTAHATLETAVEALRHGAHDYLFKPCKTVQLRESIRQGLLKRQQELKQRTLLQQMEQHLSSSLDDLRTTLQMGQGTLSSTMGEIPNTQDNDQASHQADRFLSQSGVIVDFTRHVITLDGIMLELSPTEFDLLAYLVSESPTVISPQQLVREVQGYDSDPWEASEIVRQHIRRLRGKIKKATGRTDVIRTVRGVGYRLGQQK